jgi:hypothetical protein
MARGRAWKMRESGETSGKDKGGTTRERGNKKKKKKKKKTPK